MTELRIRAQISSPDSGRIELHNDEAEQSLLGALLLKNEVYGKVVDIIKPEHFFHEAHRIIFNSIKAEIDAGRTVDYRLLKTIANDPCIAAQGGQVYLADLTENVISTFAAPDYARTVRDYYIRRRIAEVANDYTQRSAIDNNAENLLSDLERELFLIRESEMDAKIKTVEDGVNEVLEWITDVRAGEMKPIKSGIGTLDSIVSGFYPGRLYIIAGRPGMGKTVLGLNVAEYASKDHKVLFFSLEMTRKEMTMRLISRQTGFSVQKQFEATELNPHEIGRIRDAIKNKNLMIDDRSGLTIFQISQSAKRQKKFSGLDMVIIDYLGLIRGDSNIPLVQRIAEITVESKRLAKELGIPVILLSQLNRSVEDRENKRPQLSDLRDSGAIEQDADVVMMLYRGEYYEGIEQKPAYGGKKSQQAAPVDLAGKAEIIIAKNRQGECKTAHVGFNGPGQFFYDMGGF